VRAQIKAFEGTERAFLGQNDPFSPQTGQISPGGGVSGVSSLPAWVGLRVRVGVSREFGCWQ